MTADVVAAEAEQLGHKCGESESSLLDSAGSIEPSPAPVTPDKPRAPGTGRNLAKRPSIVLAESEANLLALQSQSNNTDAFLASLEQLLSSSAALHAIPARQEEKKAEPEPEVKQPTPPKAPPPLSRRSTLRRASIAEPDEDGEPPASPKAAAMRRMPSRRASVISLGFGPPDAPLGSAPNSSTQICVPSTPGGKEAPPSPLNRKLPSRAASFVSTNGKMASRRSMLMAPLEDELTPLNVEDEDEELADARQQLANRMSLLNRSGSMSRGAPRPAPGRAASFLVPNSPAHSPASDTPLSRKSFVSARLDLQASRGPSSRNSIDVAVLSSDSLSKSPAVSAGQWLDRRGSSNNFKDLPACLGVPVYTPSSLSNAGSFVAPEHVVNGVLSSFCGLGSTAK